MEQKSRIYVAGHTGLVGASIVRRLKKEGYVNIITRTHQELDLTRQEQVENFFRYEKPEYVFVGAAKVGGVYINDICSAEFIYDNLAIALNIIHTAYKNKVKKLLYLGSGCIYPKFAPQPIKEEYLLTGELEKTNEAYALAKISGLKMCEFYNKQYGTDFISCMPCNTYGPGDNFDLNGAHVIPALIRKFHDAKMNGKKEVVMWGTGEPIREFIYIDDIASACIFLMNHYSGSECINIGTGTEFTIRELAEKIKKIVGFDGEIIHDLTKPDGTPRKLLNSEKIFQLGWKPTIDFDQGIKVTYDDFLKNIEKYVS